VVVEAAGVGYEVFVPPVTQQELLNAKAADGDAADERWRSRSTTTPPRTSRSPC